MRVAALYDIHANPVALRAVLAELARERVDLIVIGGDAVPGPLPVSTIERPTACWAACASSTHGSVGMPFEGRPGAYWALLGPDVRLRRTDYDIRAAEAELRGGGWPGVDDFLRNSFMEPADPLTVAEALERRAQAA